MDNLAYERLVEKAETLRNDNPELSPEQAFAKVYADPANRELARYERKAAHALIEPLAVKKRRVDLPVAKGEPAYTALKKQADMLRLLEPRLTEAQAFAKAYQDPANREIVKRERAESRAAAAGVPVETDDDSGDNERTESPAMRVLNNLADAIRRKNPKLSQAQAFARAMGSREGIAAYRRYKAEIAHA